MAQQKGMKRAEKVLRRKQRTRKVERDENLKRLAKAGQAAHGHAGHDHDHDHEGEGEAAKKETKKKPAAAKPKAKKADK